MKLYVLLLGLSALVISGVGATFSVTGLAKLFSGAPVAVMFMAGSLEFAKLICASFLHRTWKQMHTLLKIYLTTAIFVLVCITSMGIFGYLTHAYQSTSEKLKATEVRIDSYVKEEKKANEEIERLEDEIKLVPAERLSKKLELQKELAPQFEALKKQALDVNVKIRELNIQKLSFQTEIGPLLYVAQAFGKDTDTVAHWLILIFVMVFDPLAVCLVVSTSFAIHLVSVESREKRDRGAREQHEKAMLEAKRLAELRAAQLAAEQAGLASAAAPSDSGPTPQGPDLLAEPHLAPVPPAVASTVASTADQLKTAV